MFAQSIAQLCRLWSTENDKDSAFYSAIVNPNGNFSIKHDVYLSMPVRFQNGAFHIATDLRLQSYVDDMIKVSVRNARLTKRRK